MPTYKGYIDRKVTIWHRFHYALDVSNKTEFNKFMKGESEAPEYLDDFMVADEVLFETEEDLTVEDNQGQPVVEAFDKTGHQIV